MDPVSAQVTSPTTPAVELHPVRTLPVINPVPVAGPKPIVGTQRWPAVPPNNPLLQAKLVPTATLTPAGSLPVRPAPANAAPPVAHPPLQPEVPPLPSVVGKTIATLKTYQHASVFVVELVFTDKTRHYIKTKQGALELGGTIDWGTGQLQ